MNDDKKIVNKKLQKLLIKIAETETLERWECKLLKNDERVREREIG